MVFDNLIRVEETETETIQKKTKLKRIGSFFKNS